MKAAVIFFCLLTALVAVSPTAQGEAADAKSKPKSPAPFASATPAELAAEIEAMRVADVAWRKIEWKTCLLEGIRASVEENKPIIVWMFIDLPIDDKRC